MFVFDVNISPLSSTRRTWQKSSIESLKLIGGLSSKYFILTCLVLSCPLKKYQTTSRRTPQGLIIMSWQNVSPKVDNVLENVWLAGLRLHTLGFVLTILFERAPHPSTRKKECRGFDVENSMLTTRWWVAFYRSSQECQQLLNHESAVNELFQ